MNHKLLNDRAVSFTPALAKLIGLNEAIILQQTHFWLEVKPHEYDGRLWIYNTYAEWEAQFPFMSRRELVRTIKHLERLGLVIIRRFNKDIRDRTNWYTIDYDALERIKDRISLISAECKAKKEKVEMGRYHRQNRAFVSRP
jgi:hypothetical protein